MTDSLQVGDKQVQLPLVKTFLFEPTSDTGVKTSSKAYSFPVPKSAPKKFCQVPSLRKNKLDLCKITVPECISLKPGAHAGRHMPM